MIRQFYPEEWSVYKGLRLAALTEAPDAFGSTVAAESGRSDADWQDFLNQGKAVNYKFNLWFAS